MLVFVPVILFSMIRLDRSSGSEPSFSLRTDRQTDGRTDPLVLTLVAADAFEADAAVAGSRHVVAGGVVHALAQLLAAVTKRPRGTLWTQEQRVNDTHLKMLLQLTPINNKYFMF